IAPQYVYPHDWEEGDLVSPSVLQKWPLEFLVAVFDPLYNSSYSPATAVQGHHGCSYALLTYNDRCCSITMAYCTVLWALSGRTRSGCSGNAIWPGVCHQRGPDRRFRE